MLFVTLCINPQYHAMSQPRSPQSEQQQLLKHENLYKKFCCLVCMCMLLEGIAYISSADELYECLPPSLLLWHLGFSDRPFQNSTYVVRYLYFYKCSRFRAQKLQNLLSFLTLKVQRFLKGTFIVKILVCNAQVVGDIGAWAFHCWYFFLLNISELKWKLWKRLWLS
jgi:hypothetical protein